MSPQNLLILFVGLRLFQHLCERYLAHLNRSFYEDPKRREEACQALNIAADDMEKTLQYSRDKNRFGAINSWVSTIITLAFLVLGGLGWVEGMAQSLSDSLGMGSIVTGLAFFGIITLLSSLLSIPFELYHTFVLEAKHGFNRQSMKGFWLDRVKGLVVGSILGGALLAVLLWIMASMGNQWWIVAWLVVFGFSLLTVWLYPTVLAPLFNKFSPLDEGELKDKIFTLAKKVEFEADGISIMDASTRSSHGNAYFTGVFGKKKIVLFDTLVKSMSTDEIVAVLAHELGHFKLHHIRWSLIRSFFMTGFMFFLISLALPVESLYQAFHLDGISDYGALTMFSLWFGPIGFLIQPLSNFMSRRNEFAADAFALNNVADKKLLGDALLKLRENSHVMPISHRAFSTVYHSHPPLLERLKAMGYI
ncbi:STE24 endopeptidase [Pseudobacteriovorax antillogorgiicola]|uniref:STE24 endopeptidase n=1 Tax=Pseudobacteriovorax antillogorgiicola TaxID=1513793 RepID=A0A1Y6CR07_9BACT|nr:STE24 endopeptidase [Pseudobacteriovorax antillogorgiicola]SMF72510.1 STE24 endopeptidase [Pseudobacteriovorax antillogorgiicola]